MARSVRMIEVTGRTIKDAMPLNNPQHLTDDLYYKVCSGCNEIIVETWDHDEKCDLYENETLAAWVRMGIEEKENE